MTKVIDKNSVLPTLREGDGVTLELGCGSRKLHPHSIGVDLLDTQSVDIVGDVFDVLSKIPNGSAKLISSHHFIEHVEDFSGLMKEIERVLQPGGIIDFTAPHFSNPYFYSDITHRRFFGLYTFCYLTNTSPFKRKVPNYGRALQLEIVNVNLKFKTDRVFLGRFLFKKALGSLFNSCTYMKELYEDSFTGLLSCYEINYKLKKL